MRILTLLIYTRIDRSSATIQVHCLKAGGTPILMSHLGKTKGEFEDKYSLETHCKKGASA